MTLTDNMSINPVKFYPDSDKLKPQPYHPKVRKLVWPDWINIWPLKKNERHNPGVALFKNMARRIGAQPIGHTSLSTFLS